MKNEKNEEFVPQTDGYVARKIGSFTDIEILEKAYKNKLNVLIHGDTGSGKTHAVRHFCFDKKLPYMRVNLNEASTTEDLIGQWVPAENGGFKWQDGVLTRFMRFGGVFVCDEINAANAGILFVLHSVLDDERKIVLVQKDGEVVHAHPDFWFVATLNFDYEGTKPLNPALKDRFPILMNFGYEKDIEKKLIKGEAKLLELTNKLRSMYHKGEILTPVSTRTLMQFSQNKKLFDEDAAISFFINKFSSDEARAIKELVEISFGKVNNPLLAETEGIKEGN